MAFEVAFELRDSPVEEALPTIRETTIELEFERSVFSYGPRETIRISAKRIDFQIGGRVDSGLRKANTLARARVVIVSRQAHKQRAASRHRTARRIDMRHEVDSRIETRTDVADKVKLRDAVCTGSHIACERAFRRNRRCVFDDAFRAAIDVARREREVLRQLLFKAERMFIGEAELGAGSNRVRGIASRDRCATRKLMSGIDDRIHCAKLIHDSDSLTRAVNSELGSEEAARPIILG